jgi:AGZA family xanthine/uracil permease-like MFS transporter
MGDLGSPVAMLTLFGLIVTGIMLAFGIRGAMLYGVLATAAIGLIASRFGAERWGYDLVAWKGAVIQNVPDASGTMFGAVRGLRTLFTDNPINAWVTIIFVFLILDIFDTVGTLVGVAERAGLTQDGTVPRARQAMISDGVGTMAGAVMGTSTITSYIESAAGVSAGARTGLATLVTGLLLLASLFFYPVVEMIGGTVVVPAASLGVTHAPNAEVYCHPVIAPVLILIGCYMLPAVTRIPWDDMTEALPAFVTIVVMQFALSISHGIAWGFIAYVLLKAVRGRFREIHPLVGAFAVLFVWFLMAT